MNLDNMEQLINKIQNKYQYEYLGGQLLVQGDCLEVMELIDDKSVDLVLTDPPYGKNCDKGSNGFGLAKRRKYKGNWDSKIPDKNIFDKLFKIGNNQIIFGGNYFTEHLKPTNAWIVWDKVGYMNFRSCFSECELVWTSFSKVMRKYEYIQQGFIAKEKERMHPTQKPVGLFCLILNDYSKDTDLILDAFAGSFTTSIACIRTNRQSICIEKDEEYYKLGVKRVKEELRQDDMFRTMPKAKIGE